VLRGNTAQLMELPVVIHVSFACSGIIAQALQALQHRVLQATTEAVLD